VLLLGPQCPFQSRGSRRRCPWAEHKEPVEREGDEAAYSFAFFASCSYSAAIQFRELAQLCETGFLEGSGSFTGCSRFSCWIKRSARPIQRAAISTIAALSLGLLICRERVRKYCALRRHSPEFMSPLPRIGFSPATYKGWWVRKCSRLGNSMASNGPRPPLAIPLRASMDRHAGEATPLLHLAYS
jgi:hypothetical protein